MSESPRVVLDGLIIGESPRWHDDRLWFCNWEAHEVIALAPDGSSEVVIRDETVSPHSIGWLPDGQLLIVPKKQEEVGRLVRRNADGSVVEHADLSGLPGGLNEIVVDGRGNTYVNGANFDFLAFMENLRPEDAQRPLHEHPDFVPGFIALIRPDGTVRQVADDIAFPNGMVVTPDNSTLIIAESFAGRLTAFDIDAEGDLSNRRVWADGLGPDGITIDAEGAVWTSTADDSCVRVADGGEILDRVEHELNAFACMLGGPDRRTLYLLVAEWNPMNPFGARTGKVLAHPVTIPAPAGHNQHSVVPRTVSHRIVTVT